MISFPANLWKFKFKWLLSEKWLQKPCFKCWKHVLTKKADRVGIESISQLKVFVTIFLIVTKYAILSRLSGLKLILHESGGARKAARIVIKLMSILVKTADIEAWFGPFQTTEQILEELLTWLLKTYMWFSPSNNRCLCFLTGFIFTLCLIRVNRLDCWTRPPRQVSWNSRSTYQW